MPKILVSTIIALSAIAVSWGSTEIFRRWALKKALLDFPNERSSHTRPTPRGGGIGIVFTVLAGGVAILIGFPSADFKESLSFARMGLITAGALMIAAISWMDDIRHGLTPSVRFVVHSAAAGLALIVLGGWTRMVLPFIGMIELSWMGIPLALFWIVGLVNVYNFMDGIDGIAGVQAVTAAAGWLTIGILSENVFLTAIGILIGSSAIGFLLHNWPPAKIFMGDIGSAFLGYIFAILPLLARPFFSTSIAERLPVAGFLMLSPFIVDATFTLFRRLSRKEKLSQAHRSHLYQRLVLSGLSHRTVTLLYLAIGIVGSTAGIGFTFLTDRFLSDIFTVAAVVTILIIPLYLVSIRENRLGKLKKSL